MKQMPRNFLPLRKNSAHARVPAGSTEKIKIRNRAVEISAIALSILDWTTSQVATAVPMDVENRPALELSRMRNAPRNPDQLSPQAIGSEEQIPTAAITEREGISPKHYLGLSIDGGGVRGITTATFLERLGEDYNCARRIPQVFDYIGGTSIGGLEALCLATNRRTEGLIIPPIPTNELVGFFENLSQRIFPTANKGFVNRMRTIGVPRYDNTVLRERLHNLFQETLLRDTLTPVLVTSCYENSQHGVFLFDTKDPQSQNFSVVDAGMSTSAGIPYLPSYRPLGVGEHLIDGGFASNNPSSLLFSSIVRSAQTEGQEIRLGNGNVTILSLGTGLRTSPYVLSNRSGFSVNTSLAIIDRVFSGSSSATNASMQTMLGTNYMRFNPELDRDIMLDEWENGNLESMKDAATIYYDNNKNLLETLERRIRIKLGS